MQNNDFTIGSVTFSNPNDTRNFAPFTARLEEIFKGISNQLGRIKLVTSVPSDKELQEILDSSDIVIYHATLEADRKIYYKFHGTVFSK